MELAIFSCVNLIAETAARAEVRTFHKNKELHGLEHYAWNVQPKVGDPEIPEAWANEYAKTKNYDWGDGGTASTADEPVKQDGGGGEASNGAENQL